MRSIVWIASLSLAMASVVSAEEAAGGKLEGERERASYGWGYELGKRLEQFDVDPDIAMRGIRDAAAGTESVVPEEELRQALQAHSEKVKAQMQEKAAGEAAGNLTVGATFLAENAKADGVKVTDSGLQYQVLEKGKGDQPAETDQVKVHYRGTLLDGTEFDSSYKRGQPATFPLNRVIKGWTEGLQLMKVGAKYKFVIPAELAYGATARPSIPGNSTLIFEVELIEIL